LKQTEKSDFDQFLKHQSVLPWQSNKSRQSDDFLILHVNVGRLHGTKSIGIQISFPQTPEPVLQSVLQ